MIAWLVIILLFILLYLLNILVCMVYCKMKKKQEKVLHDFEACDTYSTQQPRGIKYTIKQLLNGWMIYSVKCLGKVPCQWYRKFILKYVYQMELGKNVVIYGDFFIRAPWNISVGEGTIIGDSCQLDGRNGLVIGKNVNFSTAVYIYTEQHDVNDAYFRSNDSGGTVVIEDYVWLSSRTTVLPKVRVGQGAVLASGALANKDLEAFGVYVGIPAKKIGNRSQDLKYEFDGDYLPFI